MRRIWLLLALCFLLCGCAPGAVSELYALPQLSEEYISLQALIDGEIAQGSEFSSPVRGSNRQSVQLTDLDGSGALEALAFFRAADSTLKICIYREGAEGYILASAITGEGSSIARVEYADLDGDGITELIVAWQLDGGITMLNVYSLRAWSGTVLLTANCAGFAVSDLDGDGGDNLMLLRYDAAGQGCIDLYTLAGGEMTASSAALSRGFSAVTRLTPAMIGPDDTALLAEGSMEDGATLTDVFAFSDGVLRNISLRADGVSPTARETAVYAEDIDGDGVIELPATRRLRPQGDGSTEYWAFDWQTIFPDGSLQTICSTFHCYADGWYMDLAPFGRADLSIRREDSLIGRCMVISAFTGDTAEDLVAIYAFTGENRYERARTGGRVFLAESGATVYAMRISSGAVSGEDIENAFHLIRTAWISPGL